MRLAEAGDDDVQLLATDLLTTDFLTASTVDPADRLKRYLKVHSTT
jgi:hypothetical protein